MNNLRKTIFKKNFLYVSLMTMIIIGSLLFINSGKAVPQAPDNLRPGDLVYFDSLSSTQHWIVKLIEQLFGWSLQEFLEKIGWWNTHFVMYIGNNEFIESRHDGVVISDAYTLSNWWTSPEYHWVSLDEIVREDAIVIAKTWQGLKYQKNLDSPIIWPNDDCFLVWFYGHYNPHEPIDWIWNQVPYGKYLYCKNKVIPRLTCTEMIWAAYMQASNNIYDLCDSEFPDEITMPRPPNPQGAYFPYLGQTHRAGISGDRMRDNQFTHIFVPDDPPIENVYENIIGSTTTGSFVMVDNQLKADDPENKQWTTIQKAIDNLDKDNVIYVKNGIYIEDVVLNKSVTFLGENIENSIIEGTVTLIDSLDYELYPKGINYSISEVDMTGNELLFHFNNDSSVGEDYLNSSLIYDYSGLGNNGTFNSATWTNRTIKGNGSFDFDETSSYIDLDSIPALTNGNVTISAWIEWGGGEGTEAPIISQLDSQDNGYCLYINKTTNKPCFRLDDTIVESSIEVENGWYNIVGIHNESTLKVIVNGENVDSTYKVGAGVNHFSFIGFDNSSNYFPGIIDEVAVWNRTLSEDEILDMYQLSKGIILCNFTIKDSNGVGIKVCNNSEILNCNIVNHPIGINIENSSNILISTNISECDNGIQIKNCNSSKSEDINFGFCNISKCENGMFINSSSNIDIFGTLFDSTNTNLTITSCNISSIDILFSKSLNNTSPDISNLSGPVLGNPDNTYTYYSCINETDGEQWWYQFDWGDGNSTDWIGPYIGNVTINASHSWAYEGGYYVTVRAKDVFFNETEKSILFQTETLPPLINSIEHSPDIDGLGQNISITVNASDDISGNYSGVQYIMVNVTVPDSPPLQRNYTMNYIDEGMFQHNFSYSWYAGQYNYTIFVVDNATNSNYSIGHSFNISSNATISVCTINDTYGANEFINLTDPPTDTSSIGYEFLDDGSVLHVWNNYYSYYFDADNGIQMTNHYDEYWTHNVLMLGYEGVTNWTLMYRTDELSGFTKDIDSDNETYVDITIWKDLNYNGYDFRLAIRYYLGVDDNELTVTPYIKNIDDEDIPYILGFGWEMKDIRIDMTESGDYIEVGNESYYLNQTLDNSYTNLSEPIYWFNETSNQTEIISYKDPSFYLMEDISEDEQKSLYLRWDKDLTYRLDVESRDGQYNAPVTLFIRIGTLNIDQEKSTDMYWYDADQTTYYFDNYSTGWTSNPDNMVDGGGSSYASTSELYDSEYCDDTSLENAPSGTISKVEIRAYGYYQTSACTIALRPEFSRGSGDYHYFSLPIFFQPAWSTWYDITDDTNAPSPWSWEDVEDLDCDVILTDVEGGTAYCSKVEVRVTYNDEPDISNPIPADNTINVSISPTLSIDVDDSNGNLMNITWYSNSSGSWISFGTNSSVSNGTYSQVFSNVSVNGQWWYWKVNVSDGTVYSESDVYKFYTGVQSKIVNTGSYNISGYLYMAVEYLNGSTWELDNMTINETTLRTVNISDQLALDLIFNGLVSTDDLTFGDGTYRVYAAFRDEYYDPLVCDDDSVLEAWYEFEVDLT